jgi:DNA-binding CsgD family transcriptional regulator
MEKTKIKVIEGPNGKRIFLGSQFPGVYFTVREAEMAQLLCDFKYREIGDILTISKRTAEYYAMNMKKKLRCTSKRELVFRIIHSGLLEQLKIVVDISHILEKDKND